MFELMLTVPGHIHGEGVEKNTNISQTHKSSFGVSDNFSKNI